MHKVKYSGGTCALIVALKTEVDGSKCLKYMYRIDYASDAIIQCSIINSMFYKIDLYNAIKMKQISFRIQSSDFHTCS